MCSQTLLNTIARDDSLIINKSSNDWWNKVILAYYDVFTRYLKYLLGTWMQIAPRNMRAHQRQLEFQQRCHALYLKVNNRHKTSYFIEIQRIQTTSRSQGQWSVNISYILFDILGDFGNVKDRCFEWRHQTQALLWTSHRLGMTEFDNE